MNILEEAESIVGGERRQQYGPCKPSFESIARLWAVVLGIPITPHQVILCMIQLKIARELNNYKRDSWVDIAGYARCREMLEEELTVRNSTDQPTTLRPIKELVDWYPESADDFSQRYK